jgi:hypothetical protein
VYSNLRCRDWKNTDSIKKELRELLKQRKDYVPEDINKALENKEEDINKAPETKENKTKQEQKTAN